MKNKSNIVAQIPIFITARGNNENIFIQNKEALKFSYIFIKGQNLFDQTYIISDNKEMLDYAKHIGFTKFIHYPCGSEKDVKYLEYLATYRFSVENNYKPDWIIILNINQIFKCYNLIADCIRNIEYKYDVVASYTEISNRSHFFVDEALNSEEYKNDEDLHLLTSEHQRVKMVDACIYAVRTDFAFECMEFDDPSTHFWKGKIKYFKNCSVYTDIYDINDINKYYKVGELLNEVKQLK